MDQGTARVGAQELHHQSPKREVPHDRGEKLSLESTPSSSRPSVAEPASEHAETQENRDVETARTGITDRAPVKVPHSKRRGLFGRFTIVAEVEEPKDYSRRTKWFITFVISLAAVAAPLGSTIIFRKSHDLPAVRRQ